MTQRVTEYNLNLIKKTYKLLTDNGITSYRVKDGCKMFDLICRYREKIVFLKVCTEEKEQTTLEIQDLSKKFRDNYFVVRFPKQALRIFKGEVSEIEKTDASNSIKHHFANFSGKTVMDDAFYKFVRSRGGSSQ